MPKPAVAKSADHLPQIAALPTREVDGRTEVCLVTTRETGRWTVPQRSEEHTAVLQSPALIA